MIDLISYTTQAGTEPFARWRDTLDPFIRARVLKFVTRLGEGNFSLAKAIGAGLSELRIDFGPGYRVYFGRDGDTLVILLGGGTKKRQQNDIEEAKTLWREYKQRKKAQSSF